MVPISRTRIQPTLQRISAMPARLDYRKAAPGAIDTLVAMNRYLDGASIDKRLRTLIETRVSMINGCAYCVDLHSHAAREAGETEQRLLCLPVWRETTLFDARERAALAWADALTRAPDGP